MVSKSISTDEKQIVEAEKKTVSAAKKTVKQVSTKKTASAAKTGVKKVVAKENLDPVKKVLEIKASNDEKKAKKVASKVVAKKDDAPKASVNPAEQKSAKKVIARSQNVKQTAQVAAEKKFTQFKKLENPSEKPTCLCAFKDGAFAAWGRTYKNIFNFKGRTSRYEFWAFMLVNFIFLAFISLLPINLTPASDSVNLASLSTTAMIALSIFGLIELLVYLSLTFRRLHDVGCPAWRGFFAPMVITLLVSLVLTYGSVFADKIQANLADNGHMMMAQAFILTYSVALLVANVMCYYYQMKIMIAAAFYEEERQTNEFGEVRYCDDFHKFRALRYAALFLVIGLLVAMVAVIEISSLAHL